jgi:hypothetical protein
VGCAWVGSVLRLLLLEYSMCIRGALRCFFNKICTYQKKKLLAKKNVSWFFLIADNDLQVFLLCKRIFSKRERQDLCTVALNDPCGFRV